MAWSIYSDGFSDLEEPVICALTAPNTPVRQHEECMTFLGGVHDAIAYPAQERVIPESHWLVYERGTRRCMSSRKVLARSESSSPRCIKLLTSSMCFFRYPILTHNITRTIIIVFIPISNPNPISSHRHHAFQPCLHCPPGRWCQRCCH